MILKEKSVPNFCGSNLLKLSVSVSAALFYTSAAQVAFAEKIGSFEIFPKIHTVKLTGPITLNTSVDFDKVLSLAPNLEAIQLDSPGGVVVAALEIANKVHSLGLNTLITSKDTCASACSIIYVAGKARQTSGNLGVHQLSQNTSEHTPNLVAFQFVIADVLDSFERFGVDPRIIRKMLTTPPNEMYFFNEEEINEFAINRATKELASRITTTHDAQLKFANYPVEIYKGKTSKPIYTKGQLSEYRQQIKYNMGHGPNFAGHYNIVQISCGTQCSVGILINAKNGQIYSDLIADGENYELAIVASPDSSLLRVIWKDTYNEKRVVTPNMEACVKRDYLMENGKLRIAAETSYEINQYGNCSQY